MVLMNYIATLTFTRKIVLLQFLSDCSTKTMPSKTKISIWKFFPIIHPIIYHHQKAKKNFHEAKVIEGPEAPKGPQL